MRILAGRGVEGTGRVGLARLHRLEDLLGVRVAPGRDLFDRRFATKFLEQLGLDPDACENQDALGEEEVLVLDGAHLWGVLHLEESALLQARAADGWVAGRGGRSAAVRTRRAWRCSNTLA